MWPLFLSFRPFCVIDFSKIYQSKCWKSKKNKGQKNFYECCDLMNKVYLTYLHKQVNGDLYFLPLLVLKLVQTSVLFKQRYLYLKKYYKSSEKVERSIEKVITSLLFYYFFSTSLYFCTSTFLSIGTSTKKVQTSLLKKVQMSLLFKYKQYKSKGLELGYCNSMIKW